MVGPQLPAVHPILETLWNAKLLHNHLKRCCVMGRSSVHRNNAPDNPGAAAARSKTAPSRHRPQSGRRFVAARFFKSLAHPGGSAFPSAEVGSPGSLGRGWAILKAGFTFVPAEKLFMFQFHDPAGTRIVSKKFRPLKSSRDYACGFKSGQVRTTALCLKKGKFAGEDGKPALQSILESRPPCSFSDISPRPACR
jgi:hypothetical protein